MVWDNIMTGFRYRTANRRKLASVLAFFIAMTSSFVPSTAYAFWPAAAVALVARGGSVLATGWARTAVVNLIGGTAMAAIFSLPGDTSVRIPLTSDQAGTDSAMPAPSAPGTTSPSGNTGSGFFIGGYDNSCRAGASAGVVCSSSGGVYSASGSLCLIGGVQYGMSSCSTAPSCPFGYTSSGATCVLSNARVVSADGKYDLVNTGSGYSTQAEADAQPSNVAVQNGKAVIWGTNSDGEPFVTEITSTAAGTTVKSSTQTSSGVQQSTYTLSGSGVITQAESGSYTGSIDASGAIPSVQTGSQTTPVSLNIPGDYARTGEAAQAAASIVNAIDAPSISSIDRPGANKDIPDFDTAKKKIEDLPSPDLDWTSLIPHISPGDAVACVPIPFEGTISVGPAAGLSSTTELDMCWMFEIIRNILGWLFGVATLLYIWRTLTSSESLGK